jgi:hypothetical protein
MVVQQITRAELERRWERRFERELSYEGFVARYYEDFEILPVAVLPDDDATPLPSKRQSAAGCRYPDVEARGSTENCDRTGDGSSMADSRGGQKPFDRKGYQRAYMKLWRARKKEAKE